MEFPRVIAILSDEEARGFMCAYDMLFGVKEKSKAIWPMTRPARRLRSIDRVDFTM
jgi:hypothetical protein